MPNGFSNLLSQVMGGQAQPVIPTEPEITWEERQQAAREEIMAAARNGNTRNMNTLLKLYGPEGPDPIFDVTEFGDLQGEAWGIVHKNKLKQDTQDKLSQVRQQEAAEAQMAKAQAAQQAMEAQAATQQGYPPQGQGAGYSQMLEQLPPGGTEGMYEV